MNIIDDVAPTAVLDDPTSLPRFSSPVLSAARSFDIGGAIVQYAWSFTSLGAEPVTTTTPTLTIDPGVKGLPFGLAILQLVVTDDSGNLSNPATLNMTITF